VTVPPRRRGSRAPPQPWRARVAAPSIRCAPSILRPSAPRHAAFCLASRVAAAAFACAFPTLIGGSRLLFHHDICLPPIFCTPVARSLPFRLPAFARRAMLMPFLHAAPFQALVLLRVVSFSASAAVFAAQPPLTLLTPHQRRYCRCHIRLRVRFSRHDAAPMPGSASCHAAADAAVHRCALLCLNAV